MEQNSYLYHYTSLENLALILENRTICFNNLMNVDDVEEASTTDMGDFGKYFYVSCWTNISEESIPMWKMYTSDMHGVRIKLPIFPFKKHLYKKGEYNFTEDVTTYIDYEKLYNDNVGSITANMPLLTKVNYTDDESLIYPQIRQELEKGAARRFAELKGHEDIGTINVKYSYQEMGRNKHSYWSFQNEYRYIISIMPMGLKDYKTKLSFELQQEFVRRLENPNTLAPYQRFFLDLDEEAVKQAEILFGPKMTEGETILAVSLLEKHGLKHAWKKSHLQIR